jgi:hypothetical protein
MFMPPPDPQSSPRAGREAAYAYAEQLLNSGSAPGVVTRMLMDTGIDERVAAMILADLLEARANGNTDAAGATPSNLSVEELEKEAIRETGRKKMAIGALILIVGLVVTGATYAIARGQGGGSYVVASGAILVGAFQFWMGLAQSTIK